MNTLKTIITVIAISVSTVFSVSATEKNSTEKPKTLRTEIVSLLGANIPIETSKSYVAEVSFIVNNNNEIIVVSVDSTNKAFNSFVKSKLNYKKVTLKNIKKGEIYRMPIKINKA